MAVLINELSLEGQFTSEEEFEQELDKIIKLCNLLKTLNINIMTSLKIYNSLVFDNKNLGILISQGRTAQILKFKRFFDLGIDFFWDTNQKHSASDSYLYQDSPSNGTSLAEACERRKEIISFKNNDFLSETLILLKNENSIELKNYTDYVSFFKRNDALIIDMWSELSNDFQRVLKTLLKITEAQLEMQIIHEFYYSNDFKNQLINIPVPLRKKCLEQIVKRLSYNQLDACRDNSLKDEPIAGRRRNNALRRFRITVSSGRIHYTYLHGNEIKFESLNLQHDADLN